jgi:hypothetical protein
MATKTRIYTVRNTEGKIVSLVRAASPAQVGAHMARRSFHVAVATQDDLVHAMSTHRITVEEVREEEPAPAAE